MRLTQAVFCLMQGYTGAVLNSLEKNHGENVVKRQTQDFLNMGHIIYVDSFFSSVSLFGYFREHGTTMAVGTVIASWVGVPRCLHPQGTETQEGVNFPFKDAETIFAWRWMTARMWCFSVQCTWLHWQLLQMKTQWWRWRAAHETQCCCWLQSPHERCGPVWPKPWLLLLPLQNHEEVQEAFHLIHLAKVQSYILYKQAVAAPLPQSDYTKQIIQQLLRDIPMKKTVNRRHPSDIKQLTARHFMMNEVDEPPSAMEAHPSLLHKFCSFRNPDKNGPCYLRKKETTFKRKQCNLGMCFEPCFKIYHTRKNYKWLSLKKWIYSCESFIGDGVHKIFFLVRSSELCIFSLTFLCNVFITSSGPPCCAQSWPLSFLWLPFS